MPAHGDVRQVEILSNLLGRHSRAEKRDDFDLSPRELQSEPVDQRLLIRAVEVALAGESVIPRAGVNALIDELRGGPQEQTSIDGFPLQLTRREADVMKRRREGMNTKEIAYELDLSDVTVRRHLSSVARKARQARPLTLALESTS